MWMMIDIIHLGRRDNGVKRWRGARTHTHKAHTHTRTKHTHTRTHVHTYTHACMHVHTHIHTNSHKTFTRTHTYTHSRKHAYTRTHALTHLHTRIRTHARAHAHAHTYTRMHVCTRTHAYTHTHTHKHTHAHHSGNSLTHYDQATGVRTGEKLGSDYHRHVDFPTACSDTAALLRAASGGQQRLSGGRCTGSGDWEADRQVKISSDHPLQSGVHRYTANCLRRDVMECDSAFSSTCCSHFSTHLYTCRLLDPLLLLLLLLVFVVDVVVAVVVY